MRMHGARSCTAAEKGFFQDCPNEPWSFGNEAYEILSTMIHTREKLRPYLKQVMAQAQNSGRPPMRPLFFDFSGDENAWDVEDQYMFGDDLMVAPVLEHLARSREVYFPSGATWTDFWDESTSIKGGQSLNVSSPLHLIPVFRMKK